MTHPRLVAIMRPWWRYGIIFWMIFMLAAAAQVAPEDMPAFLAARAQNDALMFDRDGQPLYWKAKSRGICYDLRGEYFPEPAPRCFEAPPPVRNAQTAPADPFYWE